MNEASVASATTIAKLHRWIQLNRDCVVKPGAALMLIDQENQEISLERPLMSTFVFKDSSASFAFVDAASESRIVMIVKED